MLCSFLELLVRVFYVAGTWETSHLTFRAFRDTSHAQGTGEISQNVDMCVFDMCVFGTLQKFCKGQAKSSGCKRYILPGRRSVTCFEGFLENLETQGDCLGFRISYAEILYEACGISYASGILGIILRSAQWDVRFVFASCLLRWFRSRGL